VSVLPAALRTRAAAVWAGLVLASLVSFWLGTDHGFSGADGRRAGTAIVLAIAFVKIRFIGLDFMELRHAPLALRLAFEGWCLIVGCAVVGLLLAGDPG
jgi:hypothetical protein